MVCESSPETAVVGALRRENKKSICVGGKRGGKRKLHRAKNLKQKGEEKGERVGEW